MERTSENARRMPNIFIGSSHQRLDTAHAVKNWLQQAGDSCPYVWDDADIFNSRTNEVIFTRLLDLAVEVHGAVLILAEDDELHSSERITRIPRDNVLVELGLFLGALGERRTAICVHGSPKLPGDLGGVIYLEAETAKDKLIGWAKELRSELMTRDMMMPEEAAMLARTMREYGTSEARIIERFQKLGYWGPA